MIREVLENKIGNKLNAIIMLIGQYCGDEYKEEIYSKAKKIQLVVSKGKGVAQFREEKIYVGEEPICVKEGDLSNIILPINILEMKTGNVVFAHVVLHALFEDVLKEYSNGLYEVVIDYMANEIAKYFENIGINITLNENPIYESESFYSKLFPYIKDFYEDNKKEIFDVMIKGNECRISNVDEVAKFVENYVDQAFSSEKGNGEINVRR